MITGKVEPYTLKFITPGGTSRGVLLTKDTYFLHLEKEGKKGVGECALFRGLSQEDSPKYEEKLQWLLDHLNEDYEFFKEELRAYPSLWIGYEQAIRNLEEGSDLYYPSAFTEGKDSISINGLIWMGDRAYMEKQIQEKLDKGFHCLKLKIGTHWEEEKKVLENLRGTFPSKTLELRVDANGAFGFSEAKKVLEELHQLEVHSIEQPIKKGRYQEMAQLCRSTPVPIALDEELIGVFEKENKRALIEQLSPQYLILKPSLCGGFSGTDEWIQAAESLNTKWWITSALESNIGLNALAQYTYTKKPSIPQGLGTGGVFSNNLPSSLILEQDRLYKKR